MDPPADAVLREGAVSGGLPAGGDLRKGVSEGLSERAVLRQWVSEAS